MKFGSLFSGIGGFDLGLDRAGMQCAWQVENNPYCLKVLNKHWPNVPKHEDIKEVDPGELEPVELICGGFPCQPFSVAGKRGGKGDGRYLWPEMFKIIQALRPTWVLGENVVGIIDLALDTVLSDLENEGYSWEAFVIPACAINAPHRRDRVWIVGYAEHLRLAPSEVSRSIKKRSNDSQTRAEQACELKGPNKQYEDVGNSSIAGFPNWAGGEVGQPFPLTEFERSGGREVERDFCGMAHGVSNRVDRLKCLGNAVVPQIVEILGRAIMKIEEEEQ